MYRNGASIVSVPITRQPFSAGTPQTLFTIPNLFGYDVTADGKRFVVAQDAENQEHVTFVLVTGWFEELRARMRPSR